MTHIQEQSNTRSSFRGAGAARQILAREHGLKATRRSFTSLCSSDWLVKRLRKEQLLPWHGEDVTAVEFSPSGRFLASGSQDTTVAIWDWSAGRNLTSYASGHVSSVVQVNGTGKRAYCEQFGLNKNIFKDILPVLSA